ncbi:MAG TPA: hypothetical protein VG709_02395, partial [Actinomycetota bacterium]|nr:hypothetical protein [Actinomycetota bacterium]
MSPARQLLDRVREDRRVRRDFERLILDSGLEGLDREPQPRPQRARAKRPRTPTWRVSRAALAILGVLVLVSSVVVMQPFPYDLPAPYQTAFVYARDGRPVATLRPPEDR